MALWRIHLKPQSDDVDPVQFCLDRSCIGVGWGLESPPSSKEDYLHRASLKVQTNKIFAKGWKSASKAILERMAEDDLVWARDRSGRYFLGRVYDGWMSLDCDEAKQADIRNAWRWQWFAAGLEDAVPGKVVSSFRRGKTVQQIHDGTALDYSKIRFNTLAGQRAYVVGCARNLFSLLSDQDLEDIVGLYLQVEHRCLIYPSTCKKDTVAVEFIWCSQDGAEHGGVQVKSGNVSLDRDLYSRLDEKVFLFAASGRYIGSERSNVICLSPDKISEFVVNHKAIMPGRVTPWIEHCGMERNPC